jgi:signal transduction histidine kinase
VDHASEYDKIELVVYSMMGVGCLGFILLSMYIGGVFAQRVVVPITSLAAAVGKDEDHVVLPMTERQDEIGELARAFTKRTTDLKRVLDRERFFTGDVSHELRTPLTVIMGAAEIIQAHTTAQPVLQEASERILRTAREAADAVTVLLLLAREPRHIGLDLPETDVETLVRAEAQKYQVLLEGKPVSLHCETHRNFCVHARPELLAALIGNLIRNACLYTPQGEVSVHVNYPQVMIKDTGPGLPDFIRARLMKEASALEHPGSAGTGLGLSLVSRICDYLGVRMDIISLGETPADAGTMFTLDFSAALTKT